MDRLQKNYQAPTYVFDIDILKERIQFLKTYLPDISLCYAMKANPFVVKEAENYVERVEVCSPGEYQICQHLGVSAQKLVISGVYKTPEVIEDMIIHSQDIGIYTVESLQQFALLENLTKKYSCRIKILLRLTSGNQFGMDKQDIENIFKKDYEFLDIVGIQYFSGTQKTSLKRLKREIDELDEFLLYLQEKFQMEIQELEYGAGFPIQYFETEKTFDEVQFLQEFSNFIHEMKYQGKITIELGRSIVASCGTYLTKVVDMKTNKDQNYAIVDGGMHQIVYYGQMMAMKHPLYHLLPKRETKNLKTWNLCGSLCSINDIIVKNVELPDLQIGDILAFQNTGAYCMTEGIALFLSRDLPRVFFKKDDELIMVRDTFETYQLNMNRE